MFPFLAWSRNDSCSFIHHPSRGAGVTVAGPGPGQGPGCPVARQAAEAESRRRGFASEFRFWFRMVGTCGGKRCRKVQSACGRGETVHPNSARPSDASATPLPRAACYGWRSVGSPWHRHSPVL